MKTMTLMIEFSAIAATLLVMWTLAAPAVSMN
jgi:hypothetical protein